MIRLLAIALSNFILQNYLDQAVALSIPSSVTLAYAAFACNIALSLLYQRQINKHPVSYLSMKELEISVAALMLDPLWHAEIFKQNVEFQHLGGIGVFMLLNSLLQENNLLFGIGVALLGLTNPIILVLVFLMFSRLLNIAKQIAMAAVFIGSFCLHKFVLDDISPHSFMLKKANEFWLYEKLSFTRFSPYYTIIGAVIASIFFFLRNKKLPAVSQQIYKFALVAIILKSMSLYQFDSCILQGIFYTLPLINKNLYFIPIYSSFVFLVVYPKLFYSYKMGIVLMSSYLLYLGLLWLLADFCKIRIFRQQKLLVFAFFGIPTTIVVFSMFGRVLVLKILQESFELLYLFIVFLIVLVVFALGRQGNGYY